MTTNSTRKKGLKFNLINIMKVVLKDVKWRNIYIEEVIVISLIVSLRIKGIVIWKGLNLNHRDHCIDKQYSMVLSLDYCNFGNPLK